MNITTITVNITVSNKNPDQRKCETRNISKKITTCVGIENKYSEMNIEVLIKNSIRKNAKCISEKK
jgi:hypothetical protein